MLNASIGISVVAGLVPATSRTEKHQPREMHPSVSV
jgi:hypothetical protein